MNKNKKKILNSLENTYCRLKPSATHGVGVFAIRLIPKGQELFIGIINPTVTYKFEAFELSHLDKAVKKMVEDFFTADESGKIINIPIGGVNGMDISYFLNHSDRPNVKTIDGGSTFVALKTIKKGRELKVNYNTFDCQTKISLK